MRLFISSLSSESGITPVDIPEISAPSLMWDFVTTPIGGTTPNGYWVSLFLASDFPEITGITKKWIVIYSSHHQPYGGVWGQTDDTDMSSFTFGGKISKTQTASDESYDMFRSNTGDAYTVSLSYHPVQIPQQTRQYSTSGGSLTEIGSYNGGNEQVGWIFRGVTLPVANPEQEYPHVGYAKFFDKGNGNYEMYSNYQGANNPNGGVKQWWVSTDGINWTHDSYVPHIDMDGTSNWDVATPTWFEDSNGKVYSIGEAKLPSTSEVERPLALVSWDANYRNPVWVKWMGWQGNTCSAYRDGNELNLYLVDSPDVPNNIYRSTLDLTDIDNWIIP